ncbi:hypothetical protein BC833DRAFT_604330 [Globomyces pollinis-pini]|nr:hypothetical protein BC833DRAFT_604330 [Globomyces pollinis-pini]
METDYSQPRDLLNSPNLNSYINYITSLQNQTYLLNAWYQAEIGILKNNSLNTSNDKYPNTLNHKLSTLTNTTEVANDRTSFLSTQSTNVDSLDTVIQPFTTFLRRPSLVADPNSSKSKWVNAHLTKENLELTRQNNQLHLANAWLQASVGISNAKASVNYPATHVAKNNQLHLTNAWLQASLGINNSEDKLETDSKVELSNKNNQLYAENAWLQASLGIQSYKSTQLPLLGGLSRSYSLETVKDNVKSTSRPSARSVTPLAINMDEWVDSDDDLHDEWLDRTAPLSAITELETSQDQKQLELAWLQGTIGVLNSIPEPINNQPSDATKVVKNVLQYISDLKSDVSIKGLESLNQVIESEPATIPNQIVNSVLQYVNELRDIGHSVRPLTPDQFDDDPIIPSPSPFTPGFETTLTMTDSVCDYLQKLRDDPSILTLEQLLQRLEDNENEKTLYKPNEIVTDLLHYFIRLQPLPPRNPRAVTRMALKNNQHAVTSAWLQGTIGILNSKVETDKVNEIHQKDIQLAWLQATIGVVNSKKESQSSPVDKKLFTKKETANPTQVKELKQKVNSLTQKLNQMYVEKSWIQASVGITQSQLHADYNSEDLTFSIDTTRIQDQALTRLKSKTEQSKMIKKLSLENACIEAIVGMFKWKYGGFNSQAYRTTFTVLDNDLLDFDVDLINPENVFMTNQQFVDNSWVQASKAIDLATPFTPSKNEKKHSPQRSVAFDIINRVEKENPKPITTVNTKSTPKSPQVSKNVVFDSAKHHPSFYGQIQSNSNVNSTENQLYLQSAWLQATLGISQSKLHESYHSEDLYLSIDTSKIQEEAIDRLKNRELDPSCEIEHGHLEDVCIETITGILQWKVQKPSTRAYQTTITVIDNKFIQEKTVMNAAENVSDGTPELHTQIALLKAKADSYQRNLQSPNPFSPDIIEETISIRDVIYEVLHDADRDQLSETRDLVLDVLLQKDDQLYVEHVWAQGSIGIARAKSYEAKVNYNSDVDDYSEDIVPSNLLPTELQLQTQIEFENQLNQSFIENCWLQAEISIAYSKLDLPKESFDLSINTKKIALEALQILADTKGGIYNGVQELEALTIEEVCLQTLVSILEWKTSKFKSRAYETIIKVVDNQWFQESVPEEVSASDQMFVERSWILAELGIVNSKVQNELESKPITKIPSDSIQLKKEIETVKTQARQERRTLEDLLMISWQRVREIEDDTFELEG